GVSGQNGIFTEALVSSMMSYCEQPIILPLSNPTSQVEAIPADLLRWTKGQAIVATGSPFPSVVINGKAIEISQCNNSYIFPAIGLAAITAKISRITDNMLMAASIALAEMSASTARDGAVLPPLESIRE